MPNIYITFGPISLASLDTLASVAVLWSKTYTIPDIEQVLKEKKLFILR
jgi:hypothetical protein